MNDFWKINARFFFMTNFFEIMAQKNSMSEMKMFEHEHALMGSVDSKN